MEAGGDHHLSKHSITLSMTNEASHDGDAVRRTLREDGIDVPAAETGELRLVEPSGIPRVKLPGGGRNISAFAADIGRQLRDCGTFFVQDGEVVTVDLENKALRPVDARAFRGNVETHVETYKLKVTADGSFQQLVTMTLDTAATVLVMDAFKQQLHEVLRLHDQRLPVMRRDGRIERLEPGLDVEAKIYTLPTAIDYPMDKPAEQARHLWRDLHSEFPFCDWSRDGWQSGTSRSFAVHTMHALSHFAWSIVSMDAQRMGFMMISNSERSGKSLLAEIAIILTHGLVATTSWKRDDAKMGEKLDVAVRNRSQYIFFDNQKGHLASEEFEGFVTSSARKVRLFHTQTEVVFPVRTIPIITGNSLTWSKDIDGRMLISDLYLEDADPQLRKVKKPTEKSYYMEEGLRGDMLSAMWAFVREWDAAGRPRAPRGRAGFNEWCGVMGGIVSLQGFGDPLAQRPEELSGGNTDFADMLALVERLAMGVKAIAEFKFEDVVEAALQVNAFDWLMKGKEKRDETGNAKFVLDPSSRSKFGDLLSSTYGGRTFQLEDGRRVRWGNRGKNRQRRYELIVMS
jgi:hypothetical protein